MFDNDYIGGDDDDDDDDDDDFDTTSRINLKITRLVIHGFDIYHTN